jgi:hypothetical protein
MKVRIREQNILRRTTPAKVLALLEEKDLYQKLVDDLKGMKEGKIKVIKQYIEILDNITFLRHNLYEWTKK